MNKHAKDAINAALAASYAKETEPIIRGQAIGTCEVCGETVNYPPSLCNRCMRETTPEFQFRRMVHHLLERHQKTHPLTDTDWAALAKAAGIQPQPNS